ncbi:MAG: hypothetical protein U1F36_16035 [Planctomycetota bacterium]
MKSAVSVLLAAGITSGLALAQRFDTVPATAATSGGNKATWLPGVSANGAKQILIAPAHLAALQGRTITSISFRRDGDWPEALPQSDATMIVRIGSAATSADDPAADFAGNLPQPVEVFRGALSIAPMPAVTGFVGWTAPHVIRIPFTQGYAYTGGTLAIEIEATLQGAPAFHPLDGVNLAVAGTVIDVGAACGPRALDLVNTATIAGGVMAPASTTTFHLGGTVGDVAWLGIAIAPLPQPIDLGFLGAPGCTWYIDALTLIGAPVVPSGIEAFGGIATVRLRIPSDIGLLGTPIWTQWLELGPTGIVTSQAQHLIVGGALPSLGMAQLERMSDGTVIVAPSCGPVIGFESN